MDKQTYPTSISEIQSEFRSSRSDNLKRKLAAPRKRKRNHSENAHFSVYRARSSGATRSVLCLCERLPGLAICDLRSQISDRKSKAEGISRQLRRWADSMPNSDIRGQRYLTNKSRSKTREARERDESLKELEEMRSRKLQRPVGRNRSRSVTSFLRSQILNLRSQMQTA